LEAGLIAACAGHCNLFLAALGDISMPVRLFMLPLLLSLAACTARGADWPSLAPRPGEVSPMVPRNVAGQMRCPLAVACAPPAGEPPADLVAPQPPPPAAQAVLAEIAVIEGLVAGVEEAVATARRNVVTARATAGTANPDSATGAAVVAADARLVAALQPLTSAAFRLEALAAATRDAGDRARYADRMAALTRRIAALDNQ